MLEFSSVLLKHTFGCIGCGCVAKIGCSWLGFWPSQVWLAGPSDDPKMAAKDGCGWLGLQLSQKWLLKIDVAGWSSGPAKCGWLCAACGRFSEPDVG